MPTALTGETEQVLILLESIFGYNYKEKSGRMHRATTSEKAQLILHSFIGVPIQTRFSFLWRGC